MATFENNDNDRERSRDIPLPSGDGNPGQPPPRQEPPVSPPAASSGELFGEREWSGTWGENPAAPPPSDIDPILDEEELDGESGGGEMGFFDHLEELRWRIIKALIALAGTSLVCAIFMKELIEDVLLGPAKRLNPPLKLQNFEPMGQITLAIQVALISGLILAIPFIIWQFWGFIKPGLYERERKNVSAIAMGTILCFLVGVAFAYFVMIPTSLGFAASVTWGPIQNNFSISAYFSFILGFILSCGVVFEMPMLSYALSRFGVVTPQFLRKYWRHALVIILIAAAIITPTPDPFNQLLLAAPLYGLYELSIIVARLAYRQRAVAAEEYAEEFDEGGRLR